MRNLLGSLHTRLDFRLSVTCLLIVDLAARSSTSNLFREPREESALGSQLLDGVTETDR